MDNNILAEEQFSYNDRHYYISLLRAVNHRTYLRIACADSRNGEHALQSVRFFEDYIENFVQALSSVFRSAAYHAELKDLQHGLFQPAEKVNGIKSWERETRPREKLMEQGREAMSDAELLAMLICAGLPGVTAVDLAERVLAIAGNDLHQLAALKPADLMKIRGIGHARALSVISAMELAVRLAAREQPLHFLKLIHSNS